MHFDRIEISHFRILDSVALDLNPGLNFFHGYFTVFDVGGKRVGFARSKLTQGDEVLSLDEQEMNLGFREHLEKQNAIILALKFLGVMVLGVAIGVIAMIVIKRFCCRPADISIANSEGSEMDAQVRQNLIDHYA